MLLRQWYRLVFSNSVVTSQTESGSLVRCDYIVGLRGVERSALWIQRLWYVTHTGGRPWLASFQFVDLSSIEIAAVS